MTGIAGTAFDAAGFRSAIRFAMTMGAPPDPARQAKFVFPSAGKTYWKNDVEITTPPRVDREGKPLDPEIEIVEVPPVEVSVTCAVEITRADADELPVGRFRATKAIVTILDQEFAQINGCKELVFNLDRYVFGYSQYGLGMFDVGVHTLVFYALDES